MGNFSTDPFRTLQRNRERGYVGLHIEQGVPLLDRDLNLLADLVSSTVREILAHHLGSGIAERSDAFAVEALPAANDLRIGAPPDGGACLVGGIQVTIEASLRYSAQDGVDRLTTPVDADREDLVYLDVWVEEVDASADAALANAADVAMQTSVRLRPAWRVRVMEGVRSAPAPAAGHAHCPLARLERRRGDSAIQEEMIVDLRRTGLHLGDLARRVQRIEDVLFSTALGPIRPELVALPGAPPGSDGDRRGRRDEQPQRLMEPVAHRAGLRT